MARSLFDILIFVLYTLQIGEARALYNFLIFVFHLLQIGEARALYNLGNVYHAKGKHNGRSENQDPGEFAPEVKECLKKAAEYYEWVCLPDLDVREHIQQRIKLFVDEL